MRHAPAERQGAIHHGRCNPSSASNDQRFKVFPAQVLSKHFETRGEVAKRWRPSWRRTWEQTSRHQSEPDSRPPAVGLFFD